MILLGLPMALLAALVAGALCKLRGLDAQQAKPYILWSALAGAVLGVFAPLGLSLWAWGAGLIGAP